MSTASLSKNQWGFSPQNIAGCQLWLDAADPAGTGVTPSSGSTVSTWTDKSGRGNNATSVGSAITASATGLYFGGSSYLTVAGLANVLVNTPFAMFIVEKLAGTGTNQVIFGDDQITGTDGAIGFGYRSVTSFMMAFWSDDLDDTGVSGTGNTRLWSLYLPTASNRNIRRNGTVTATHSNYTRVANLVYPRIGRAWGLYGSYYYTGTISEIILYTGDIGVSQIQQVEAYLAAKWGLQSQLPVTHPYSTLPVLGYPGLQLWLDAADPAGTGVAPSSGSTVSTWTDKSKKGNNATSAGSAVTTSATGLTFGGSSYFTVAGIAGTIVNTAFVIFIVETLTGTSGANFYFSDDNVNSSGAYGYSLHTGYRNTTNQTFAMYGSDLEDYAVSGTGSTRIWALYMPSASNRNTRRNGSVDVTFGNYNRLQAFTAPRIGRAFGGNYFNGTIAEVIVFNEDIGLPAIQLIEKYLATKWNVTLTATGEISQLTKPPYARPFQPVDISGCQLWLDGADQQSMTFSSGTTVSVWKDKSGNGYNATQASGKTLGTYSSTSNSMYFPASTTAYVTSYPGNPTSETMFVVANNGSPNINNSTLIGGPYGVRSLGFGYSGNGGAISGRHGYLQNEVAWLSATPNGSYTTGTTALVTGYVSGGYTYISTQGGSMSAGYPISGGVFASGGTYLGTDTTNSAYYFIGYVMEIIFYNSVLSSPQIQQVEAYLSWKWGIRSSLPSTHPGYTLPSYSAKFTPKSISGLYLWLDAADSSTLVMSGTSVTNWVDKSGNGFKATPMDSAVTIGSSQNNNPTIYLPGIRMVIPNFTWNYAFTIIIACKCLYSNMMVGFGAGVASNSAWLGYVETGNWALFYMSNPGISTTDPNYTSGGNPSSVGPANQWFIFSIGYNNGAYLTNYGINGTPYNANAMTPQTGSQTGYLMINGLPGGAYDYDNIGEIVHFNYSISTYQRQQVEGYLAWKWGIASSLPSTHPFAKISP